MEVDHEGTQVDRARGRRGARVRGAAGDGEPGDRARIVGTASVPVQWYFNGFNEDYALVSNAWVGPVTASIDQVNTSTRKPVAELSACVSNVSSTPATVSFELSHP